MDIEPTKVIIGCPGCGRRYRVTADKLGRTVMCPSCRCSFAAQASAAAPAMALAAPAAMPAPATAEQVVHTREESYDATVQADVPAVAIDYDPMQPPPAASGVGVCPICQSPPAAGEETTECPHCHGIHHKECWDYNHGCGKYGCAAAPATEKLTDLETPTSYWGQSEKECPACRAKIQAAAMRCRFCGSVFASAKPLHSVEFREQRAVESDLPQLRRASIWLLILCIFPFTAAIASVVGIVWYLNKRQRIAMLPATQAALPRIAIMIGVAQTIVVVLIIILYQWLHGSGA